MGSTEGEKGRTGRAEVEPVYLPLGSATAVALKWPFGRFRSGAPEAADPATSHVRVERGIDPSTGFVGSGGLCHHLIMAKTVIVKLTDDIDGGDADETVRFSLDGSSFEIDLSAANASKLRSALKPYIDKARLDGGGRRSRSACASGAATERTLYSQLSEDEKSRFRTWADMATARRISDARVKSWVEAGKP